MAQVTDIALPFGLLTIRIREDTTIALTLAYWNAEGTAKAKDKFAKDIALPHTAPANLRAGWTFLGKD